MFEPTQQKGHPVANTKATSQTLTVRAILLTDAWIYETHSYHHFQENNNWRRLLSHENGDKAYYVHAFCSNFVTIYILNTLWAIAKYLKNINDTVPTKHVFQRKMQILIEFTWFYRNMV